MASFEKILIVGPDKPWSHETIAAGIFRSFGMEVKQWDNTRPTPLAGNRDYQRLGRVGRRIHSASTSLHFLQACKAFRPDILYLPKADNLHFAAVREALEATKARLVVWYPDHPFKADQTSWNIIKNLQRCDLFLIWGKYLVEPLRSAGCPRVEYLPFGFDPDSFALEETPVDPDLRSDICFVGTWDRERETVLSTLAHLDLAIWGPMWPERTSKDSPLQAKIRGGGLYRQDMVKAFQAATICFNHLREHNGPAHNVRSMETTGIGGGAMLVRRTPELAEELFKESDHLFCFGKTEELAKTAEDLLTRKTELRAAAKKAREHTLTHHLLKDRLQQMLDFLA